MTAPLPRICEAGVRVCASMCVCECVHVSLYECVSSPQCSRPSTARMCGWCACVFAGVYVSVYVCVVM